MNTHVVMQPSKENIMLRSSLLKCCAKREVIHVKYEINDRGMVRNSLVTTTTTG